MRRVSPRMAGFVVFISMLLLGTTPGVPPVHALDDLFDDSESGVVEEGETIGDETDPHREEDRDPDDERDPAEEDDRDAEPPEVAVVDIGALTTSPPRFSGSVSTGAGIYANLREWPWSSAADGDGFDELLDYGAGFDMSTSLRLTVRPEPHLRFTGSLSTSLNQDSASFSTPRVGSLFVDYTLQDIYYFRVGRFGMTWGQSRLLSNIGNLASDVSGGASMRLTVPAGPGSATGVITSQGGTDPRELIYAGQYETTRGRVSAGVAGRAKAETTLDTTAYVTLGLGAVDLTQEAVYRWDRHDPLSASSVNFAVLSQMVLEWGDPVWRAIGEYSYDYARAGRMDHRGALALRFPAFLPGGWRPQVRWRHAFEDHSGQVTTGFSGTIAPNLTASIGIPVNYGKAGTIYRGGTEVEDDSDDDPLDPTDEDAETRLISDSDFISVLIGVRLRFSF